MIGQTISHYKILSKLGEGGMGVVYKAEDLKLHRFVALKFLHPDLTRDEEAKARFIHEAQAAAALNHSHICTIHEIDETPGGQSFIAMEFIEGEGLKDRIQKGPLPIDDALSLAIQIGEGLHEAHERGIVHRDIKPGNVMVTSKGQAKILDFGLARLGTHTKITKTDTTLGTAAYMSPEQATGKEVDRRTDIWSLGVVLYEMVTGVRPFTGEYEPAVVYSILHDEPEPLTSRRTNVPMELERIVGKALSKNPSERYPHVEDMLVDLRALRSATQRHTIPSRSAATSKRNRFVFAGAAAGIIVIVLGLVLVPRLFTPGVSRERRGAADTRKMIVVLPFENLGPQEDEYFASGTTDAITARLASVSGLGVISRQSAIQYKKTTKTIRQIGSELGVDYILEGTVQRERPGDPTSRVRVIPQLIRVTDDTHVWAETYDENMTEVFRVESDIAERVATELDVALLEPERRAIQQEPTENFEAYDNYMRGVEHMSGMELADVELSVSLFEKAVSLDPQFAEAWAGLALAWQELYWAFDRPGALAQVVEAAKRAEELAPDLPETHLALGEVAYAQRDFDEALQQFETANRLRPSGESAQRIGFTLRRMGRWQEALEYGEKARKLLPRSAAVYQDILASTRECLREFDQAAQDADRAILLAPHSPNAYVTKATALAAKGDSATANEALLEMSRQTDIAEAAEYLVPQGLTTWSYSPFLRLFPRTFKEAFESFESGRMDRYRGKEPAIIASTHLGLAIIYEAMGDRAGATARYDSARVHFDRIIRSNPQSAYVAVYRSDLGLACAGLGRCEEAIRAGEEAVGMMPMSVDAVVGSGVVGNLAEIYVKCGKHENAIDQIETWISVPSGISPALLRLDPIWEPLRNNPRFHRLAEEK